MVAGAPLVIIGPWLLRQSIPIAAGDIRWCRQPPATRGGAGNRLYGKAASGKTIIYPVRKRLVNLKSGMIIIQRPIENPRMILNKFYKYSVRCQNQGLFYDTTSRQI
jgi:hypothetical protein